ncbi:beta-N-acetylhexosaminidase [Aestuariibaculum sediminum]|uniref:beta-N-acetylhexosaminidase n=1 Tax=Aestuariibaculum sediminum TaxID=2770637 RepID=A0A8J6Q7R7_9FLAO|nr:beta-N-acetylhexosaminidase [Aestuariibaculum sediminum]MBD0831980.1 beta-N-acetylhexosaminidase [Aestuariibaculum sediminum]
MNLKLILLLSFKIFISGHIWSQSQNLSIIPYPQQAIVETGVHTVFGALKLETNVKDFKLHLKNWENQVNEYLDSTRSRKTKVYLIYDKKLKNKEAYNLVITKQKITISASHPAGAYYGLQSLKQLVFDSLNSETHSLPLVKIKDAPRYSWRGFMLDESRHFFGKDQVKLILDMMALQKLNVFHWHLTDEPGWRIEIKQYPKLTTVGGLGNYSNPKTKARFYSQEDIKEIIAYAKDRFIQVIPEIDMPGHASAANRSYPEFNGGGNEKHPDFTFNPGKEETYQYLTNILREVALLFPSPYIHIGGDEVHFGNDKWAVDSSVKALMKRENLQDIKAVEHYFLNRMHDSILSLNKTMIGWDEITAANLPQSKTTVMWWRHDKPKLLQQSLADGYKTIMCPRLPLYFDFVQHDSHKDGRRWNGFCSLDQVYNFPNKTSIGGPFFENDLVLGIQANVWTERIHTTERLQFMIFPRLSALAEAAWTLDQNKNYKNFQNRLKGMFSIYRNRNMTYFDVFNPEKQEEILGPNN